FFFCLDSCRARCALHSFPTRRSSDLFILYGAIEAGGTKFVCAVGNSPLDIKEQATFPTETPEKTFQNVLNFFQSFTLDALGVGSDRKSTRLNSSHVSISYAVFCLKKK